MGLVLLALFEERFGLVVFEVDRFFWRLEGARGDGFDAFAGERVIEGEGGGVQHEAVGSRLDFRSGVEVAAENGVADGLAVDAELMGAAGEGYEADAGGVGGGIEVEDFESALGGLAAGVADFLVREVGGVFYDGDVDEAGAGSEFSGEEGGVGFGDGSGFELLAEVGVGGFVEGEDHDAGGAEVEAVYHEGGGEIAHEPVVDGVEVGGVLSGEAEEAAGFVDEENGFVLVEYFDFVEAGGSYEIGSVGGWHGAEIAVMVLELSMIIGWEEAAGLLVRIGDSLERSGLRNFEERPKPIL